jgi:ABC-type transport system substrate-binding protein
MSRLLCACSLLALAALTACSAPWNDPYPASQSGANIFYVPFAERPKHLDPVQAYSENEYLLIGSIYTPPLQYHYLKRPYELIPSSAAEMPRVTYYDATDKALPESADAQSIAYSVYEIHLRPGFKYQPHPAFAVDAQGKPVYASLRREDLSDIFELRDFKQTGTREVTAQDYVYQIKRLAHPRLHSPIFGLMAEHIVGLPEYAEKVKAASKNVPRDGFIDLNQFEVSGVSAVDAYTYRIKVKGKYAQFAYWLAMPFFAPIPVEVDRFYGQPGMADKNLSLDWYPVGAGPYMMTVNNPNRQMVLERNPNFPGEVYPSEGEPGDAEAGLLKDAGQQIPFIDKVIFSLDKEQIPIWNKFLQGYYDVSAISSDNFDQVVQLAGTGEPQLSPEMERQGIRLQTSVGTSIGYMGFNMLDPVVGGNSESARKLRLAISIALDQEENISIFRNGRGIAAQGPIPPGIFGYLEGEAGINHYVYDWVGGEPRRKPIEAAKQLLAEAGYPDGIDKEKGTPLIVNFDTTGAGAGAKAQSDWLIKQFNKINVQLVMRSTDYNRFQEKMRKGTEQLYYWGWNADYPDPENFLFLFSSNQSKVKFQGENASNYENPAFDKLFDRMRDMPNGPERQALINEMLEMVRHDAPWVFGLHPKDYALAHQWVYNRKPTKMGNNAIKYQRIDPVLRDRLREEWNRPIVLPVLLGAIVLVLAILPAVMVYRRRERSSAFTPVPGA